MVFSSITFIYYFLPILLIVYFIVPKKLKNTIILIFSLIFYFYGEKQYILILLASCLFNYIFGIVIEKNNSKLLLVVDVILNVLLLFYFKYTNFFIANINSIFNSNISLLHIALPLGISFFTFQTMSYVIDVYKGDIKSSKNIINFACYVCMFPQLVAGPIVRYKTIEKQISNRNENVNKYSDGITRFVIGLGKKVLIANNLSQAISLFSTSSNTVLSYWIIAFMLTLQIYYDFSGYSDMAIGLGKMFGFEFPENFIYPLTAISITDFWHRWHISLSTWLRDYIYIPLGGSRVNVFKWIRNILIVWFVTGFWHGSSYNFIIWGLYFAVFLMIEKFLLKNFLSKHKLFGHFYTLLIVIISFVIFNNTDLTLLVENIKNLFLINKINFIDQSFIYYFRSYFVLIIIGLLGSTMLFKNIYLKFKESKIYNKANWIEVIVLLLLLILVTASLIDSSFNPFLYFRF